MSYCDDDALASRISQRIGSGRVAGLGRGLGFAVQSGRNVADVEIAAQRAGAERLRNSGGFIGSYVNDDGLAARITDRIGAGEPGASGRHYEVPRLIAPTLGATGAELALATLGIRTPSEKALSARTKLGQAQLAKTPRPNFQKLPTSSVVGGKAQLKKPIQSISTQWNRDASRMLVPFAGAIDAMPGLDAAFKRKLKTTPLDAISDLFDPIEDFVGRAVDQVMLKAGTSTFNFFGTLKTIKRVQDIDKQTDATTQNMLKRLRTIDAFYVLYFCKPLELHAEMFNQGVALVGSALQAAGDAIVDTSENALKFLGFRGLGDGGLVSGPVAATAVEGTGAVSGGAIETAIAAAITTITSAITAAVTAAILQAPKDASAAALALLKQQGETRLLPGAPPTLLPDSFGPGASAEGDPGTAPASGGVPPFLLFGAAAAAAFLLLRSK